MFQARVICGSFKPYEQWKAESGMKNKGIYGENATAVILGDKTYTGWSTSRFDDKGARDVRAFRCKIEVKSNRGAFQLYRIPGESKEAYIKRYMRKASANVYCFTVMHGAKNLNGKMTLVLLYKTQVIDYILKSRHWDFEKRPGGEVLRWKCGFVEDLDLLKSYV